MYRDRIVKQIVDRIELDLNPIVPFELTYQVLELLFQRGCFKLEATVVGGSISTPRAIIKSATRSFRYIVDHGNHRTQNTWRAGSVVPHMVDL